MKSKHIRSQLNNMDKYSANSLWNIKTTLLSLIILFSFFSAVMMEGIFLQIPSSTTAYGQISALLSNNNSSISANKVIILNFYDNPKSQFTVVKPILDKYGFKASFFVVCNWVGSSDSRMTWKDILSLQNDRQTIESHTMNHRNLNKMSSRDLTYEVAQSKNCLADHGINATYLRLLMAMIGRM